MLGDVWNADQFGRLCQWTRSPDEFWEDLNSAFDAKDGRTSSVKKLQSKPGETKWRWTSSLVKGAVIVREPGGEIIVQGTPAQEFIEPTDRFTASL